MAERSIIDRMRSLLEETSPFKELSEDERETLLPDLSIEFYDAGDVILEQNGTVHPGLYLVESGMVRLMDLEQRRLIDKCVRGNTFGSLGLLRGGARFYEARALEPTACAVLDKKRFDSLAAEHENVAAYFERDINEYIRGIDAKLDISGAHLLFSQTLDKYAHPKPILCPADTTAQAAAKLMGQHRTDTLLVTRGNRVVGLLTDRILRERLIARGRTTDVAVHRIARPPKATVDVKATIFDVILRLMQPEVERVVVVDENADRKQPVAVLSPQDVVHFRGVDPVTTVRRMDSIASIDELVNVRSSLNEQMLRLYQQQVSPEQLGRISTAIYDRMAMRVLELTEAELRRTHSGKRPDLSWAWLRLGSGGRQETALSSAQRNALVYTDPSGEEEAARAEAWFTRLAEHANRALETCGFNSSTTVASNADYRKALGPWKNQFRRWVRMTDGEIDPDSLYCFDLRAIYGDRELAEALKIDLYQTMDVESTTPAFLHALAKDALKHGQARSIFRRVLQGLSGKRHRFDVRERGILPVVAAARVLALDAGYLTSSNTFDRLRNTAEAFPELADTVRVALDGYRYLVDFRLEHQLHAFQTGEAPTDEFDPVSLTRLQQDLLRNALDSVSVLQDAIEQRYEG